MKMKLFFNVTVIQPIEKITNDNVFYSRENVIVSNSCYALNWESKEFFDPSFLCRNRVLQWNF